MASDGELWILLGLQSDKVVKNSRSSLMKKKINQKNLQNNEFEPNFFLSVVCPFSHLLIGDPFYYVLIGDTVTIYSLETAFTIY